MNAADAYKVSVSLVLANGVSPTLAIIGRDLLGLRPTIKGIEDNFKGWSTALVGVGSILAGATILGAMTSLVEKSKEFNHQMVSLQRVGGSMTSAVLSGDVRKRAFDIAQRVPMKVEDLVKIPGMTYSILRGDMGEVNSTWEPLAKFGYVLKSNKDYHGDPMQDIAGAIRAGELTGRIANSEGQIDLGKLNTWLDFVAKTTAATHGMVNGQTLLGMAQQGGFTMRNLSPEGQAEMAIMAQAMGGQRTGTAYMSLWQQMAAGTMFSRTAEGMQELGFLKPDEWHKSGGRVVLSPEASKRLTGLIGKDPMVFAQKLKSALEERHITDPMDQVTAIMRLLNRQTTQRFMGEMFSNMQQQLAERGIIMQGMGAEASFDLLQSKDLDTNIDAFKASWHNLLVALGDPMTASAIEKLRSITDAVKGMGGMAAVHPEAVNAVMQVVTALAVGLATIGGIALLSLVSIPAAIGGAVAAIVTLVALNWKDIADFFVGLGKSIAEFGKVNLSFIVFMLDKIKNSIVSFIDSISSIASKAWWLFGMGGMDASPLKHKSSFFQDDGVRQRPLPIPTHFDPQTHHAAATRQPITLEIDGHTLAHIMVDRVDDQTMFSTGAAAPDGASRYFGGDRNYWST